MIAVRLRHGRDQERQKHAGRDIRVLLREVSRVLRSSRLSRYVLVSLRESVDVGCETQDACVAHGAFRLGGLQRIARFAMRSAENSDFPQRIITRADHGAVFGPRI